MHHRKAMFTNLERKTEAKIQPSFCYMYLYLIIILYETMLAIFFLSNIFFPRQTSTVFTTYLVLVRTGAYDVDMGKKVNIAREPCMHMRRDKWRRNKFCEGKDG